MAKIISVVQLKGGSGKSTIATNIAGELSLRQYKVGLIDADQPQNTSGSWRLIRANSQPALFEQIQLSRPKDAAELIQVAKQLYETCDYLIIDLPPRLHEITRASLVLSDLAIIPVNTSAAELWAVQDMLELIGKAKEKRPDLKTKLLWNKYRQSRASAEAIQTLEELDLESMSSKISLRQSYADSLGRGLSVSESNDSKAKAELESLVNEVLKEVK